MIGYLTMNKSPHQLAEDRVEMSADYARLSERLGEILSLKPQEWLLLREQCKSDASANKKWEMTEMGVEETILKLKMKALEKSMSSIKTYIEVLTNESRNNY